MVFLVVAAATVALLVVLLGGTGKLRNVEYRLGQQDHTYTRAREAAETGAVDVLFIGSSHAYRTFDPRVFAAHGLRVFNLGSSNQTPQQSEALLRRYLQGLKPRLVVMEVHPDIIGHDGVESTIYWLDNAPPSLHNVPMVLRSANAKVLCTALYTSLHNARSASFRGYDEPVDVEGNRYVSGGYVERDLECWRSEPLPADTVRPLPSQVRALRRVVRLVERSGAACLLLEVPDTHAQEEATTGLDGFRELMRSMGDFHCPRPEALCDTLHFYDPSHLNQRGGRTVLQPHH